MPVPYNRGIIRAPYESLIRYYGFYSNAARGKRKRLGLETVSKDSIDIEIDFVDDSPSKRSCRKSWAQLIYKIYEVDPLLCPKWWFKDEIYSLCTRLCRN